MRTSSGSFVLLADALFDGRSVEPILDPQVYVQEGVIVRLEAGPNLRAKQGPVLDYRGCTVVPGLIDSHVHLAMRPDYTSEGIIEFIRDASQEELIDVMRTHALTALSTGVTTLRDCGSPGSVGVQLRDSPASRESPRTIVSGRPVTTADGHCNWMGLVARSEADLVAAVEQLDAEGVDFIKVMASGGMMTPSSDPHRAQFCAAALAGLVAKAHERRKRVSAHVLSATAARVALQAGVDTLEHYTTISGAAQDYDTSIAPQLAAAGIVVGVTAHHALREMLAAGDTAGIRRRLVPHRALRDAGVTTVVHSDAGTPGTHFDAFVESIEIYRIGMETSFAHALQAATADAAKVVGCEDIGSISPGKRADLLVVDGRLSGELTQLRRTVAVFRDGHRIDS